MKLRVLFVLTIFTTEAHESRNCTGSEAVSAVQDTWVRHYGLPSTLRLDAEGAFRSHQLTQWAEERGLEVQPCAAEAHSQIGVVEKDHPNHQEYRAPNPSSG